MFIANKPYKTGKRCLVVQIDSCPQEYRNISGQANFEMCGTSTKYKLLYGQKLPPSIKANNLFS